MRPSLRAVTENWKLKLAALTLAVLLWVVVSADQVTTQWLPVPVETVSRDPDWVVVGGPVPREVQVRFVGSGRDLLELALERPVLVLPVADVEEESQIFVLDPRMVRIPDGLAVNPVDVRPSSVRVLLQRLASREVPVRLRLGARARERFVLTDTPAVIPSRVRITGPADRVAQIDSVVTEPVELTGVDSVFTLTVPLETETLPRVRVSHDRVRVTGEVDRLVERIIPRAPVGTPPGVEADPAEVELRVRGPSRRVRALDPSALRVVVPEDSIPAELPPEGAAVPLEVRNLPPGVEAQTAPVRVRVRVAPAGGVPVPEVLPESAPALPADTLVIPVGRMP